MKPKAFVYFCGRSLANLLMGSGRVQPGLGKLATEVVIAGGGCGELGILRGCVADKNQTSYADRERDFFDYCFIND